MLSAGCHGIISLLTHTVYTVYSCTLVTAERPKVSSSPLRYGERQLYGEKVHTYAASQQGVERAHRVVYVHKRDGACRGGGESVQESVTGTGRG